MAKNGRGNPAAKGSSAKRSTGAVPATKTQDRAPRDAAAAMQTRFAPCRRLVVERKNLDRSVDCGGCHRDFDRRAIFCARQRRYGLPAPTRAPLRQPPSSAAKPARAATARKRRSGAPRSTSMRWITRPTRRCSAISTMRNSIHYGVRSRFFRKDGKFFVETDGPDGKLGAFEIKYTFGLDPLQQYLVEFPDGRLQALSIAWDSRPKDQRGPALVPPLSGRANPPRRFSALDQAEPELELHVRRVSFDRRAQELRCGERSLRDAAGPRSAWAARPVTAAARVTSHGRGTD